MSTENTLASGVYTFECIGADGVVKWTEKVPNKVVNVGIQYMASVALTAGATAVTQITAWYLGLITGPGSGVTIAAGDTLSSHSGWTESTPYAGNRPACNFAAATTANPSVATNSASRASFTMNTTATLGGAFLCSAASGTSGTLFSANTFTAGDRSVVSGDTLNVTYTFSLTAT